MEESSRALCRLSLGFFSEVLTIYPSAQGPCLERLHAALIARLVRFKREALQAGVASNIHGLAQYLLCAWADETITKANWGGQAWNRHRLMTHFHGETSGAFGVFTMLRAGCAARSPDVGLLELISLCLMLEFRGPYQCGCQDERLLEEARQSLEQRLITLYAAKAGAGSPRGIPPELRTDLKPGRNCAGPVAALLTAAAAALLYAAAAYHLDRAHKPLSRLAYGAEGACKASLVSLC